MPIEALRTPEEAFAELPGYPWAPNYIDDLPGYERLRLHYIDTGPGRSGRTWVCLHGQPSWSYLYRRMIPIFEASGHRVVAPDLFGFGRSDKPVEDALYTFEFHRNALLRFLERIEGPVTLVVQDWGGILGLTLPMENPRIDQIVVMNTALAVGAHPGDAFLAWRDFVAAKPDFSISGLMRRGTPHLTQAEAAAYDAPFPDSRFRAGARRFPALLPITPEMPGADIGQAAQTFFQTHWQGKSFVAIGEADPVLGPPVMDKLASLLGVDDPMRLPEGGHFLQEWGEPIAKRAVAQMAG
ncbi:MAG: haloalkane dehalogenase [Pseudomonadota bacterium]